MCYCRNFRRIIMKLIKGIVSSEPPHLNLSVAVLNFDFPAETQYFDIDCNTSWSISDDMAWLSIMNGTTGSGDKNVEVYVIENPGAQRTGVITVTAGSLVETIDVTQALNDS